MKLWIFSGHTASFKIEISKVQDFGNFELSPMLSTLCIFFLLSVDVFTHDSLFLEISEVDGFKMIFRNIFTHKILCLI